MITPAVINNSLYYYYLLQLEWWYKCQHYYYSLPLSSGRARTSLIRPSVRPCTLLVWFSSKIPRILENVFVANGKRFCTKGRRPLVFRIPIRNVPFSIRYICVSKKHKCCRHRAEAVCNLVLRALVYLRLWLELCTCTSFTYCMRNRARARFANRNRKRWPTETETHRFR